MKVCSSVCSETPHFTFYSANSSPSTLFWEDKTIQSAEGVQQGDPLGPFCLTIQQLKPQLTSEFQMFYLDDGTLGGSTEDLRHDLQVVEQVGEEIGLKLNEKTEVICCSQPYQGHQLWKPKKLPCGFPHRWGLGHFHYTQG